MSGAILINGQPAPGSLVPNPGVRPGNLPLTRVQVALTDPFSAWPEWVDITPWTTKAQSSVGRQHELQQSEAATLNVTVDNRAGLFDQWSTASPFRNQLSAGDSALDSLDNVTLTAGTVWSTSGTGTTALDISPATVQDAIVLAVRADTSSVTVTGVTGSGVDWSSVVYQAQVNGHQLALVVGQVTAAGATTATVAFSGSVSAVAVELAAIEYAAVGAPGLTYGWLVDSYASAGSSASTTAVAMPPLWPGAVPTEAYVGILVPTSAATGLAPGALSSSPIGSADDLLVYGSTSSYMNPTLTQSSSGAWSALAVMVYPTTTTLTYDSGNTLVTHRTAGPDHGPALVLNSTNPAARTGGYPVAAGTTYSAFASFSPQTVYGAPGTVAAGQVSLVWYDSAGTELGSQAGALVWESPTGWTKASVTAEAPTNVATAKVLVTINGTLSQDHLVARLGLTPRWHDPLRGVTIDNTAWGPGGVGIGVARPVRLSAQIGGTSYAAALGYVRQIVPRITTELARTAVIHSADAMALWANGVPSAQAAVNAILGDNPLDLYLAWTQDDTGGTDGRQGALLSAVDPTVGPAIEATPAGYNAVVDFAGTPTVAPLPYATPEFGQVSQFAGGAASGSTSVWGWTPQSTIPSGTTAVTLEAWVYGESNNCPAVFNTNDTGASIAFLSTDTGLGVGQYYTNTGMLEAGASNYIEAGVTFGNGCWNHYCATFDTVSGDAALYMNTVKVATGTLPGGQTVGTTWTIGYPQSVAPYWTGGALCLSMVGIYNYALSAEQIEAHFAVGNLGNQSTTVVPGSDPSVQFNQPTSGQLVTGLVQSLGMPPRLASLAPTGNIAAGTVTVRMPQFRVGILTQGMMTLQQTTQSEIGFFWQNPGDESVTFLDRTQVMDYGSTQATLDNTSSPGAYLYLPQNFQPTPDDLDLWNHVAVSGTDITGTAYQYEAFDPTSIRHFGQRTYQGSAYDFILATVPEVETFAQVILRYYSQPLVRVRSVSLSSLANQGVDVPQMLERWLNDTVLVIYTPATNSTRFEQLSQIEKITHEVSYQPAEWVTKWSLVPAYTGGAS